MSVTQVKHLLGARIPLIFIDTHEERRVMQQLLVLPWKIMGWSASRGLFTCKNNGQETVVKDIKDPLRILDHILEMPSEGTIFVLHDYHLFLRDNLVVRKIKDLAHALRTTTQDGVLIIGQGANIPPGLVKEGAFIHWPLPDATEFEEMIKGICRDNRFKNELRGITVGDVRALSSAMLGLTGLEAENALARSLVEKHTLDRSYVHEQKAAIVRQSGLMDFLAAQKKITEIGGMGHLKKWVQVRTPFFNGTGETNPYNLPKPKGVLLIGIQGCGKTLFAEGLATFWKMPLLRFDVGRVYSGTVGSSEANMREAIRVAESVSPAILLVDEIEKAMAGTQSSNFSDGGTTSRVFATFLSWLQDRTKGLFIIATANNLDLIPPELLRKGRFDEIFFVDLPSLEERKQIFNIHFARHNLDPAGMDMEGLARHTDGYSGAEIEQIVISTLYESVFYKTSPDTDAFLKTAWDIVPLSKTMQDHIAAMRRWSQSRARPAGVNRGQADGLDPIRNIVSNN